MAASIQALLSERMCLDFHNLLSSTASPGVIIHEGLDILADAGKKSNGKGLLVQNESGAIDGLSLNFYGRVVERATALNLPRHLTVEIPVEWIHNGEPRKPMK